MGQIGKENMRGQTSVANLRRREFMQYTAAAGAAAGSSVAMLSPSVQASTPKFGGHARVGWHGGATIDSLDPVHLTSTFTGMLFYTIGS